MLCSNVHPVSEDISNRTPLSTEDFGICSALCLAFWFWYFGFMENNAAQLVTWRQLISIFIFYQNTKKHFQKQNIWRIHVAIFVKCNLASYHYAPDVNNDNKCFFIYQYWKLISFIFLYSIEICTFLLNNWLTKDY